MAWRLLDQDRRDWIGHGLHPHLADFVGRHAKSGRIDFGRSGQPADQYRNIVALAMRANDIGEQKGAAIFLAQSALELPARERMKLRIFIDHPIDAGDQSTLGQQRNVFLQIGGRHLRLGRFHCEPPAPLHCVIIL